MAWRSLLAELSEDAFVLRLAETGWSRVESWGSLPRPGEATTPLYMSRKAAVGLCPRCVALRLQGCLRVCAPYSGQGKPESVSPSGCRAQEWYNAWFIGFAIEFCAIATPPLVEQWVANSFVFRTYRLPLVWRVAYCSCQVCAPLVRQGSREFSCFSKKMDVGGRHGSGVFLQHGTFFWEKQ